MSEVARRGQRSYFSPCQYVTLIGGRLLAVLVIVILEAGLSEDLLRAWGWRNPFVIGAAAAVVGFGGNQRVDWDASSLKLTGTTKLRASFVPLQTGEVNFASRPALRAAWSRTSWPEELSTST